MCQKRLNIPSLREGIPGQLSIIEVLKLQSQSYHLLKNLLEWRISYKAAQQSNLQVQKVMQEVHTSI